MFVFSVFNRVIKHIFHGINNRQVSRELLKTKVESLDFQQLPRALANANAMKNIINATKKDTKDKNDRFCCFILAQSLKYI